VRQQKSRSLADAFEIWPRAKLALISQKSKLADAIRYALSRWEGLTRFIAVSNSTTTPSSARSVRSRLATKMRCLQAPTAAPRRRALGHHRLPGRNPYVWMAPVVQEVCLGDARKAGGLHVSGLRKRRHVWPPAQMRSADRVHNKLTRLRRLQVYWVSRSRLSLSRHLPIQRRCTTTARTRLVLPADTYAAR